MGVRGGGSPPDTLRALVSLTSSHTPNPSHYHRVKEDHGAIIYALDFNRIDPSLSDVALSAGGPRATVYRCAPGGALAVLQAYVDADKEEELYACGWGHDDRVSRGVGGREERVD